MLYFSYNDFIDCIENGEIKGIIKLEENVEKYELKNEDKIQHQNKIIEILREKIQMKKFLKEFLNLSEIGEVKNLICYNDIKTIINEEINKKIIYKIEDKEIFILVKVIEEIDYNISYKMLEDSLKIIQKWDTEERGENKRNPIVIPIVIYIGKEIWENKKIYNTLNYITIEKNRINFSYNIVNINDLNIHELNNMNCKVAQELIKVKNKYLQIN